MKKTYVKPAMAVEMFAFAQTVASGCGVAAGLSNHWDRTSCGIAYHNDWLWQTAGKCDYDPADSKLTDVCYNAPQDTYSPFSS